METFYSQAYLYDQFLHDVPAGGGVGGALMCGILPTSGGFSRSCLG
jgi:hypothetical protein